MALFETSCERRLSHFVGYLALVHVDGVQEAGEVIVDIWLHVYIHLRCLRLPL